MRLGFSNRRTLLLSRDNMPSRIFAAAAGVSALISTANASYGYVTPRQENAYKNCINRSVEDPSNVVLHISTHTEGRNKTCK